MLKKRGIEVKLFEQSSHIGGLAKSFEWHGVKCDIGPHRFYTHDSQTLRSFFGLVKMKKHRRKSKIFMSDRIIKDPINPIELILKFPVKSSVKLIKGYILRPKLTEDSFESMALNNYGKGLYDLFFEPYTRKLFGVSPSMISEEWGKQKLRSSGLIDVLKRNSKTFFKEFYYPIHGGYGAICDSLYSTVHDSVILNARVTGLTNSKVKKNTVIYQKNKQEYRYDCERVISTIPSNTLGNILGCSFNLKFKAIKLVYLCVNKARVMPYHWIYFGDSDVAINRLAEFKNFSEDHSAVDNTVLCAEVTIDSNDPVEDVIQALEKYNLIKRENIVDILTIPIKYGYPIYNKGYEEKKDEMLAAINSFNNLHLVGRNAEFKHIDIDEDFLSAQQLVSKLYDAKETDVEEIYNTNGRVVQRTT